MGSLLDAYELGGVAGHGRATVVRLGVRRGDASPVALKQLRMEHAQDPQKRVRFVQQARQAAMLQHEHIETVLDVVESREGPVVVAEWVDGRSLERLAIHRRRNEQPWTTEEVVLIARCMLEALRHAHHQPTTFDAQGMLHGGLWPGNVLVDVEGNIKLVDFGLAAVWQEAPEPWQDLESLRYLSAEHVHQGATTASDLFSAGAIVHELLAGRRFRDEHATEAQMRRAIDEAEPPERPREDVPPALERLRRRLLEPVQSSRLVLDHMLDLCVAIPVGDARTSLRALVRETLRNDSTAPEPDTPPRGTSRLVGPELQPFDEAAHKRSRDPSAVHLAGGGEHGLGIALQQIPLGQSPRRPRRRDTPPVPMPVVHERTAARRPMFLQQTAPPVGEEARRAERERSGSGQGTAGAGTSGEGTGTSGEGTSGAGSKRAAASDDEEDDAPSYDADVLARAVIASLDTVDEEPDDLPPLGRRRDGSSRRLTPQEVVEVDTAPLPVGEPEVAVPEPVDAPDDEPEPLELSRPGPRPVERDEDITLTLPVDPPPRSGLWRWLQSPVGWALLGAAAVGIGVPLAARCSADDPPPAASAPRS